MFLLLQDKPIKQKSSYSLYNKTNVAISKAKAKLRALAGKENAPLWPDEV